MSLICVSNVEKYTLKNVHLFPAFFRGARFAFAWFLKRIEVQSAFLVVDKIVSDCEILLLLLSVYVFDMIGVFIERIFTFFSKRRYTVF